MSAKPIKAFKYDRGTRLFGHARRPKCHMKRVGNTCVTSREAADLLGVSAERERAWWESGALPSYYSVHPWRMIDRRELIARMLIGGHGNEGIPILRAAVREFPVGYAGQDGAHAAEPLMLILANLPR